MTPYALYHQYHGYRDHRLNAAGDGLLCGRPLPARGNETTYPRLMCRACSSAWEEVRRMATARLRTAGCRCYIPSLVLDGRTAMCQECGAVVEEATP